jgi:hypothetical protein
MTAILAVLISMENNLSDSRMTRPKARRCGPMITCRPQGGEVIGGHEGLWRNYSPGLLQTQIAFVRLGALFPDWQSGGS